jgi:hypothetical protein
MLDAQVERGQAADLRAHSASRDGRPHHRVGGCRPAPIWSPSGVGGGGLTRDPKNMQDSKVKWLHERYIRQTKQFLTIKPSNFQPPAALNHSQAWAARGKVVRDETSFYRDASV